MHFTICCVHQSVLLSLIAFIFSWQLLDVAKRRLVMYDVKGIPIFFIFKTFDRDFFQLWMHYWQMYQILDILELDIIVLQQNI